MIIDSHCHAGKGDRMTAPWNTDAPTAAYLRRARAAGLDKTIMIAPLHGNYSEANAQTGTYCCGPSRTDDRFHLLACNPGSGTYLFHGQALHKQVQVSRHQGTRLRGNAHPRDM